MKILIVGTGYVGLVTGACFAEMGHQVICLDIDRFKISQLAEGKVPIYEPGLEEIVRRNLDAGRLEFTTDYAYGVKRSFVCFLAVSTPPKEDGSPDMSFVKQAILEIGNHMDSYKIIVSKSTVPIGSAHEIGGMLSDLLKKRGVPHRFDIVSNPEFLKEGDAVNDFMKPDRIVIGIDNAEIIDVMQELYAPFNLNRDRVIFMDTRSAEITKYAANAMLACRISFMNELAGICERTGADISKVRRGIGSDARIGCAFLYAGVGYGGSCFPKDIKALRAKAVEYEFRTPLLDAIETVNERQKRLFCEKIAFYFETRGGLKGKTVAIWGLAFKPGTDDMREAPSLELIRYLLERECHVRLYDPVALKKAREILKTHIQITWCTSEFEAAKGADAIALMTEWKQFRFVDFGRVIPDLKGRGFFDGRNQYNDVEMTELGFDYHSIGRPDPIMQPTHVFS